MEENNGYLEPFCGILGVYQHIPRLFQDHPSLKYRAGDINESVIKIWKKWLKTIWCLYLNGLNYPILWLENL